MSHRAGHEDRTGENRPIRGDREKLIGQQSDQPAVTAYYTVRDPTVGGSRRAEGMKQFIGLRNFRIIKANQS